MKQGFSLIELIVGIAVLAFTVSAGTAALKPITQANRKFRLTTAALRLEDEIRRGVYYQSNYGSNGFAIYTHNGNNSVKLAQDGKTLCVRADLLDSVPSTTGDCDPSIIETYPLKAHVALESYTGGLWGIIYQVSSSDPKFQISTIGVKDWPADPHAFVGTHYSTETSLMNIPSQLALSAAQNCNSGFMRGLTHADDGSFTKVCWEYQAATQKAPWSVPSAFILNAANSTITLNYSPLSDIQCPPLHVTDKKGNSWSLNNFYGFSTLDMTDLFPKKPAGAILNSQCELAIDFKKDDGGAGNGLIPASVVTSSINNNPGLCPDRNLYVLNSDKTCTPNFDLNSVPNRVPAVAQ